MKKKLILMTLVSALFVGTLPSTGWAEKTESANIDTVANQNIYSSDGELIIDDTYQYCVEGDTYFAYMWVPETAEHINGVLFAKSNLSEARVMQSKTVRDVLAKYNIGIVYMHARSTTKDPGANTAISGFDYRDGEDGAGYNAGAMLDEAMARFAAVSGFDELRYAPFIGVGHSAGMGPGSTMGSWDPTRTIAQICLKAGTSMGIAGLPDNYEIQPGVPTYYENGQFTEHAGSDDAARKDNYIDGETANIINVRQKGTDRLITMSIEWEAGHYDWSEQSNEMMAAYLDEIIPLRLGEQATSQEKLPEDYELADLTKTGYVADVKMFGTRTTEYDEADYPHGNVSEFTEEEQKNMVWFPSEKIYNDIRNFTNDRKDIANGDQNEIKSYVTYDRSYNNTTGDFSFWPAGNICYYVSDSQSIAMEFDISELKDCEQIIFSAPFQSGNFSRNITVSQIDSPWTEDREFTVPVEGEIIAENISANSITIDVTDAVKNAEGDKLYLRLSSSDSGSGSDFYAVTEYPGYSNGSLMDDTSKLPRLEGTLSVTAGKVTKHQYIQMEDPSSKEPKPFTRITRYDAVNPNDSLYAEGLENDPMTFAMYVDKMSVVSPDHIGAGEKVANVSDSPAVITALMAPVEWVGVEQAELTESDIENNVSTKWKNILRWKNNRLYYRNPAQDSYMTLNAFDCYDDNGDLEFAYTTNAFMIYPLFVSGGQEQHITMPDIEDVNKDFTSFTVTPQSSAGLTVDLMVDYGPVKAELNADGSYTITPDQIPAGAQYPIECKLVASQFGVNNNGTKINTAEPVEKIFYINDDSTISELPLNGEINQNMLISNNITGFMVEGSGNITLSMNSDTKFDAEQAANISSERAESTDENYKKHYQFPAGYNPYDHWEDYPCEWTAEVTSSGFVPLSMFTNGEKKNINLRYLNEIKSEGITSIVPVTEQTEITDPIVNSWGNGVNIVWQRTQGDAYDSVKVYIKNGDTFEEAENVVAGSSNALVTGLEAGNYTFKVATVKDGVESDGVEASGTVDGKTYLVEDFEAGDLTSGMNLLEGQDIQPVYSWITSTGAGVDILKNESNHYLGMQNNYTFATQTVNISIPGGLNKDMTELHMDILVDKLENSQSAGQVYIELFNPVTGKSYGMDKGDDFALEDKDWHKDYTIKLSGFNLPKDEEELSQITVLKIGRKAVGGGNNNRRAKIYLDNISLFAAEPVKTSKITLSADNAYENNADLPNGTAFNAEQIGYLFDGDVSNTNLYKASNQKYVYFDLGAEYKIAKIVLTEYTTKGTLVIQASNEDPETITNRDDAFKQILRTNGSTSNGVVSSYEDINDGEGNVIGRVATANDIYTIPEFETIRYICMGDWSNSQSVAELEIYVVDESVSPSPTPSASPSPTPSASPSPTPSASPSPSPTATVAPTDTPEFSVTFGDAQRTENGIKIPAKVTGNGSADAVVYVAEYSGEKLSAIKAVSERTITETGDINIECSISDENIVKVFVWDKQQNPLSDIKILN